MTTFRNNLLSALAVLSMGATAVGAQAQTLAPSQAQAQAQGQPAEGRYAHAASQEQRAQRGAERAAERVARLHDALKITPAQENAWNAFVASMKPPARADRAQRGQERAALAALPAPQRFARHIERRKQRTAAMEQRLGALNSLYAVLTPQQKKTFDEKAHFGGRSGKHHGHRGGWERGGERGGDTARG